MVAAHSPTPAIGTPAPTFALPDPAGRVTSLDDVRHASALLVTFLCNHCPYVTHLGRELGLLTQRFMARGVAVVGINSNDGEAYPDDGPDRMPAMARGFGWDFPYLVDAEQTVARAYGVECTPDFFLYDKAMTLAYHGRFDASRPGQDVPVTGTELRAAVEAVLSDSPVAQPHRLSMGCSIKWRPELGLGPGYS